MWNVCPYGIFLSPDLVKYGKLKASCLTGHSANRLFLYIYIYLYTRHVQRTVPYFSRWQHIVDSTING